MTTAILPANNGAVEQGAILLAVLASSRDHKAHAVAIHDGFMSKFVYFCCGLLLLHTGQKQDMQNCPVVDALDQIHEKARVVLPNWIQISKYKCTTSKGADMSSRFIYDHFLCRMQNFFAQNSEQICS